ncbi:MAG: hypothetical protein HFF96_04805 [Oscillibacter sp.]|uniref:hypothetical protein n=1 Tax=Oscillibacter sp. TaxID=1945593 RepID=UPI002173CD44|nr:hypothetical protein [Oscillibacter sp.]MCI9113568.1 hypothetical protein [Oscillibacter sp.]
MPLLWKNVGSTRTGRRAEKSIITFALLDAATRYLDTLKVSGESITPKAWRAEAQRLTAEKEADYLTMRAMREDIKAVETLKKTADRLAREGQTQHREEQER